MSMLHGKWKTVRVITEDTFCFYFALRGVSTHHFFVLNRSLHKDFKVVAQYSNITSTKNKRRGSKQTNIKSTKIKLCPCSKRKDNQQGSLKLFYSKGLERNDFLATQHNK